MTVVSVVGSVNGHDVVCTQKKPDVWVCDPGEIKNGRYVAEFWATDEAGNIGYKLAILYVYDGRCVKIEWIDDDIHLKYINDGFDIDYFNDSFNIFIVRCEGEKA